MVALSQSERLARLRLIRSENVGPVTFLNLLERFGSAKEALKILPDLARQGGRENSLNIYSRAQAIAEIDLNKEMGARLMIYGDNDYPKLLSQLSDPPGVLSLIGDESLLTRKSMAVVGSRDCSMNSGKICQTLVKDLGEKGFCIVSGMARGIDAMAHLAALDTGSIAVMAGGIDVIYPKENKQLYHALVEQGLVISEMLPGSLPVASSFPRRNRIVSGLCEGVLVVEAKLRSGSLITARYAGIQGREIFSVPGSPLEPRSRGNNDLIRQGAHVCENVHDITKVLEGSALLKVREQDDPSLIFSEKIIVKDVTNDLREQVLSLLSPDVVSIEELIQIVGASVGEISMVLLELELAGKVARLPGHLVCLLPQVDHVNNSVDES